MSATVELNGNELVIRVVLPESSTSNDRLIRVDVTGCRAEGLEFRGVLGLIHSGALPSVKIGRARFVRMSDLLALVRAKTRPAKAEAPPVSGPDLTAIGAALGARAARRRKAS